MSIWRSPVFYFGVALLAAVMLLLAAPFILDWNAYKPNLEAYGRRLTGRDVAISGDIEVRLFPWPRLTAEQVLIGNPQGIDGPPLLDAERLTLALQLGGLLNGTLNVDRVQVEGPHITLIRNSDGAVNWMLQSDEDLRQSGLLADVRLDQIAIGNGTLQLDDRLRGFSGQVAGLSVAMAAPAIEGPWRVKGDGLWRAQPVGFTFTSSVQDEGKPFGFGLRVSPGDMTLPAFVLDGAWDGSLFDGSVRLDPQEVEGQTPKAQAGFKPLRMEGLLVATPELARLREIRISPADEKDSGTLVEGSAVVDLGAEIRADMQLKAPRINLDALLGAQSQATLRSGGFLALANGLLKNLPSNFNGKFGLTATTVTAGGQTIDGVELAANIGAHGIAVSRLRANLPGRSAVLMEKASIVRKDGVAELSGDVGFESGDARSLATWLWPDNKAQIEDWWSGSRGRIKLQTGLAWSPTRLAFTGMDYELEGLPGKAELVLGQGGSQFLDVRVTTKSLDLDGFLKRRKSDEQSRGFDMLGVLDRALGGPDAMEKHFVLQAGGLTLNGVTAQDVAMDFVSGQSGLEIKTFDMGNIGGARLTADGLVLRMAEGPSGEVKAKLVADDPRGVLRLLGLADGDSAWSRKLGRSDVDFVLTASSSAEGPTLNYAMTGTTGPFAISAKGSAAGLEHAANAALSLDATLRSDDAAQIAGLLGAQTVASALGPGEARLTLNGTQERGFAITTDLQGLGARMTFSGQARSATPYLGLEGQGNLLADDLQPLFAAYGVPLAQGPQGRLRVAYRIAPQDGGLILSDVVGDHDGQALSGEGRLDARGAIGLDLGLGHVSLTRVMMLAFLPWEGAQTGLQSAFAGRGEGGWQGEVWLRPTALDVPVHGTIKEAIIGMTFGDTRSVKLSSPSEPRLGLEMTVAPTASSFKAEARGRFVAPLEQVFRQADGVSVAAGVAALNFTVSGEGRSPAAALSALSGSGYYQVNDFALKNLNPEAFAARLAGVQQAEDLKQALDILAQPGSAVVPVANGSMTITNGVLSTSPVQMRAKGAETAVIASADIVEGRVTLSSTVRLTDRADLPTLDVSHGGPIGAVQRRSNTSALAAKLGHEILARDLAKLEELKQEQERLAVQEEAQRQADVAKFDAYQAQRSEVRQRMRELRVYRQMADLRAKASAEALAELIPTADAANDVDVARARLAMELAPQLAKWARENADPVLRAKRDAEIARKRELEAKKIEERAARAKRAAERRKKAEAAKAAAEAAPTPDIAPDVPPSVPVPPGDTVLDPPVDGSLY